MTVAPWPSGGDRGALEDRAATRFALAAADVLLIGRGPDLRPAAGPSIEALPALVSAYVGDGVVALAEPTHAALPESVLMAGARYVDVGRDHGFRIDGDGLRWATGRLEVRLGWFLAPDWPTGLRPSAALLSRAERAGLLVVLDERLSGNARRAGVSASRIRLVCHDGYAFALSAPETLLPLRRVLRAPGPMVASGAECASEPAVKDVVPVVPVGRLGAMASLRVAGVPSLTAAQALGGNTIGSRRWTWRDLVVLPERRGDLTPATQRKAK